MNSEQSGESKVSLPALEVNGQRRRSMTDPGSNPLTDDSGSEVYTASRAGTSPNVARSNLPGIAFSSSDELHRDHHSNHSDSAIYSELGSENLDPGRRNSATQDFEPVNRSSTKGSVGSSKGRRLREAFTPRQSNRSTNSSPDRASSKSSGGKQKGLLGSSAKKPTFPSKKSKKSDKDIPPLPTFKPAEKDLPSDQRQLPNNLPPLDTTPKTPPPKSNVAPITTMLTPPTPKNHVPPATATLPQTEIMASPERMNGSPNLPPNAVVSPSGNMISHRRVRSASAAHNPSKLSNSVVMTPTIEESNGSGLRNQPGGQPGGGFFSSMFSAAQNAASTFSIGLNAQQRPHSSTDTEMEKEKQAKTSHDKEAEEPSTTASDTQEKKESAVDTLGMGDLDFSHLGIDSSMGGVITTPDGVVFTKTDQAGRRSRGNTVSQRDELAARIEDVRAARAVSMAYEKPANSAADDSKSEPRAGPPLSGLGKDSTGEQTPPLSLYGGDTGDSVKRSNSLRSRRSRRHRGSSAATAATIGAIGAAAVGLGLPGVNSNVPRLTGFAVASKKRNRDFHQLFRSVPEDDYLIEDYSCALQREIILAGRVYVSEGHICFSSNILGWVTTLVIGFDEIMAIEKESTAMVFPNAIAIQTLHARHTFRSFLGRDSSYDLMVNIWKINHPALKSSVNGTKIDQGTGDLTEKADASERGSGSVSDDDDEVYDEDEEAIGDEDDEKSISADSALSEPVRRAPRKSSTMPISATKQSLQDSFVSTGDDSRGVDKAKAASDATAQFPGPKTHAPTEFTDPSGRYERQVKDEIIPAPLGQIYSLVFGPSSGVFMSRFLLEYENVMELQFEDDKKGLTMDNKARSYTYIKPLNGSIGPKQTKCTSAEQLDFLDLEKAVLVTLTTQTPDVPSGNSFSVKTKYLFTWAPGNATRFQMTCTVEWSAKSWLKGPIEKGANDGQATYGTNLVKALRVAIAPKTRKAAAKGALKGKGKRARAGISDVDGTAGADAVVNPNKRLAANWGVLEPLRGPLGPVVDTFRPLWSGNVALGVICALLFMLWFRAPGPSARSTGVGFHNLPAPERLIAYDELWQREESDLWDWLEERVGMDGLAVPVLDTQKPNLKTRQRIRDQKDTETRLREEKMSEREIEDAIRVTQERLDTLREVVDKRKYKRGKAEKSHAAAK